MGGFSEGIKEGIQNAAGMYSLYTAPERMDMERRKMALEERAAARGDRVLDIQERQAAVMENGIEAQWNKSLQMKPTRAAVTMTKVMKDIPQTGALLKPLLEQIDSGDIATRSDFRNALFQAKASGAIGETRRALREEAAKLMEKGDKRKAQQLMGIWETTADDRFEDFVDDIMGKPYQLRRKASDRPQPSPPVGGPKVWDERTQSWLQQSSDGTWKKIVQAPSKAAGRRVYDAEGNLILEEGSDLTTKTKGVIEEKVVDTGDEITRLENIIDKFDPQYLTIGGKAKATFINIKDKLMGGKALTSADKEYMKKYSSFAQDTVENINLYIKRITGAQMSEKEANRLRLVPPDMGDNWFAGDGPTKFKAKADNALSKIKAANKRYQYYLSAGLTQQQVGQLMKDDTAAPLSQFEEEVGPKVGAVEGGYRFKGGDPSNSSNWEKVK